MMTQQKSKYETRAEEADRLIKAGRVYDGMQIIYEMLTEDIETTVTPNDVPLTERVAVLDMAIHFFATPAVEEYDKCATLRDIKKRLMDLENTKEV